MGNLAGSDCLTQRAERGREGHGHEAILSAPR
jgi:hypothetical protein